MVWVLWGHEWVTEQSPGLLISFFTYIVGCPPKTHTQTRLRSVCLYVNVFISRPSLFWHSHAIRNIIRSCLMRIFIPLPFPPPSPPSPWFLLVFWILIFILLCIKLINATHKPPFLPFSSSVVLRPASLLSFVKSITW